MTEEEAKTKWCPFVRLHGGDMSFNRYGAGETPPMGLCIGSACMAWRWVVDEIGNPRVFATQTLGEEVRLGSCGLAGKP